MPRNEALDATARGSSSSDTTSKTRKVRLFGRKHRSAAPTSGAHVGGSPRGRNHVSTKMEDIGWQGRRHRRAGNVWIRAMRAVNHLFSRQNRSSSSGTTAAVAVPDTPAPSSTPTTSLSCSSVHSSISKPEPNLRADYENAIVNDVAKSRVDGGAGVGIGVGTRTRQDEASRSKQRGSGKMGEDNRGGGGGGGGGDGGRSAVQQYSFYGQYFVDEDNLRDALKPLRYQDPLPQPQPRPLSPLPYTSYRPLDTNDTTHLDARNRVAECTTKAEHEPNHNGSTPSSSPPPPTVRDIYSALHSSYKDRLASLNYDLCSTIHQSFQTHRHTVRKLLVQHLRTISELDPPVLADWMYEQLEPLMRGELDSQKRCALAVGELLREELSDGMLTLESVLEEFTGVMGGGGLGGQDREVLGYEKDEMEEMRGGGTPWDELDAEWTMFEWSARQKPFESWREVSIARTELQKRAAEARVISKQWGEGSKDEEEEEWATGTFPEGEVPDLRHEIEHEDEDEEVEEEEELRNDRMALRRNSCFSMSPMLSLSPCPSPAPVPAPCVTPTEAAEVPVNVERKQQREQRCCCSYGCICIASSVSTNLQPQPAVEPVPPLPSRTGLQFVRNYFRGGTHHHHHNYSRRSRPFRRYRGGEQGGSNTRNDDGAALSDLRRLSSSRPSGPSIAPDPLTQDSASRACPSSAPRNNSLALYPATRPCDVLTSSSSTSISPSLIINSSIFRPFNRYLVNLPTGAFNPKWTLPATAHRPSLHLNLAPPRTPCVDCRALCHLKYDCHIIGRLHRKHRHSRAQTIQPQVLTRGRNRTRYSEWLQDQDDQEQEQDEYRNSGEPGDPERADQIRESQRQESRLLLEGDIAAADAVRQRRRIDIFLFKLGFRARADTQQVPS